MFYKTFNNIENNSEITIIPIAGTTPQSIETSIAALNKPLANYLIHLGLPTENILSPIEERRKVIWALESTLEILHINERERAYYLSKFTVAVSVGLFDGALSFLWDETVKALRRLVASFDLEYFFNVAESMAPTRYKNLTVEEDLVIISEHDMLEICRRIGLLNDVNFKRLEYVNYLRNHASAAHPNDNQLSGLDMLSLLEHCLKYAITAKPDISVIQIKTLLNNIRRNIIPTEDFQIIGSDIAKQPQERIDDFLISIFGIYCDPRQEPKVKSNIEGIIPFVWNCVREEVKLGIGAKYGLYRKNGDVDRKNATQRVLEVVDGLQYKDEDSLAAELIEKLQDLRNVHFEWNNFYNEYTHAKSIQKSIPGTGIPKSVRKIFVKIISLCWIGNGLGYREGVDKNVIPYYESFIEKFEIDEVKDFLTLFSDNEFVGDLHKLVPDKRVRRLAKFLKTKTTDVHINKVLDLIIAFPTKALPSIAVDARYKEVIKFVK